MKTETFDTPEAFMLALHGGKPRQTRGRSTRPDLPSAGRSAPTGLTGLIAPKAGSGRAAWSIEYRVGRGWRMFVIGRPALDTGFCPSELAACDAAKGLTQ